MLKKLVAAAIAGLMSLSSSVALGQQMGGGGFGGGGSSFGGGSSGGGFGGSSFGGSSGGAFGSSGFGGSGGGGFGSGGSSGSSIFPGGSIFQRNTTGGGMSGRNSFGTTGPFGRYYGNPLAIGLPTTTSPANQYQRTFPVPLTFGTPLYGTANLGTSSTGLGTSGLGTTGLGGRGLGGLGTGGLGTTSGSQFSGASSVGIRRSPGYVTEPVFERSVRPGLPGLDPSRVTLVSHPELQSIVSRSTRLPSRDNIRVLSDGETVFLRGMVGTEKERRLTEAVIRLNPGVRDVQNDLEIAGPRR
ncbi:MAG: BON domain-containing protein [Gemmataceae bacterium]